MDLIEVKVSGIKLTTLGFAVFLRRMDNQDNRILPIFIGPLEAHAINSFLEGQVSPRPLTHDLFLTTVNSLGGKVIRVVIDDIIDNTFYAKLSIRKDEEIFVIDARPSDSIAISLRADAPIFVSTKVFNDAAIYLKDEEISGETDFEGKEEIKEEDVRTPLQILEDSLAAAIQAEDYENAARIRDQIKKIVESS